MAELLDDDLMLVNRNNKSYKISGIEIKESLQPPAPPTSIVKPSILAPQSGAGESLAIDADNLTFIGSTPAGLNVTSWGNATWEVATDIAFGSAMVATKAITPGTQQTLDPGERGAISLEGDTQYYARLKYDSTVEPAVSAYSDVVTFKTAEEEGDADVSNSTAPGTPYLIQHSKQATLSPLPGNELAIAGSLSSTYMKAVGLSHTIFQTNIVNPIWSAQDSGYEDGETGFIHLNDTNFHVLADNKTASVTRAYNNSSTVQLFTFPESLIFFKTQSRYGIAITKSGDVWFSRKSLITAGDGQFEKANNSVPFKKIATCANHGGGAIDGFGIDFDGNGYTFKLSSAVVSGNSCQITDITEWNPGTKYKYCAGQKDSANTGIFVVQEDGTLDSPQFDQVVTARECVTPQILADIISKGHKIKHLVSTGFSGSNMFMTTEAGGLLITGNVQSLGPWVDGPADNTQSGEFNLPAGYHTTFLTEEQFGDQAVIILEAD